MMENKIFKKIVIALFWLIVWFILALLVNQELLLPAPLTVIKRLCVLVLEKEFWLTCLYTILRILLAVIIGTVVGIILGVIGSKHKFVDEVLEPIIKIIRATPVTSFIILLMLYLSYSLVPVVIGGLMVMPLIYTSVLTGIKETDYKLIEIAKVFRLSKKKIIRYIYIPSVKPFFSNAFNNSLGFAWKAGVAAEVISLPTNSIGSLMYYSKLYLETSDLFAYTAVVIVLSFVMEKLISKLLNKNSEVNLWSLKIYV